jgi:hypothetical protein
MQQILQHVPVSSVRISAAKRSHHAALPGARARYPPVVWGEKCYCDYRAQYSGPGPTSIYNALGTAEQ